MTLVTRVALLLALLPAVLGASITVGPASNVSDAEIVGAFRPQNDPSVAFNGDVGLVVWQSRMPNGVDFLLASRIDASGRPLDAAPTILRKDTPILFSRVVTSGSRFLVVWLEAAGEGTHGAFVERDGAVRQLPLHIDSPFYPNDFESVGDVAVLAGNSGEGTFPVVLHWIDRDGNVFATKSFGANAYRVQAARAGNEIAIAWWDLDCAVYTCDHSFYTVDASPRGTTGEIRRLRFADDADVFAYTLTGFAATADRLLLLFTEARGVMTGMIFDRFGNALSTAFSVEDAGANGVPVGVATDGQTFVVAYPHAIFQQNAPPLRSTRLRRLTTAGASNPSILSDDTRSVVLTPAGPGYLMLRSGGQVGATESVNIVASTLTSSGEAPADAREFIISRAPNQQDSPSIGSGLPVWEEFFPAEGLWKIRAARGVTVSQSAQTQRTPKVVFDGATFLAVWVEGDTRDNVAIRARRLRVDGSPVGPTFTIASLGCPSRVDAVRLGNDIAVTYLRSGCDYGKPGKIELVTIGVNDTVSTPVVVTEGALLESPVIAASSSRALVVWTEGVNRTASEPCPYIYEYCPPKQVLNGAVIDGRNVRPVSIAAGELMINREPQLAWNGSRYLVAWLAGKDVNTLASVNARPFDENGTPLAPASVLASAGESNFYLDRRGSVAPFGSGFLVAWQRAYLGDLRLWQLTSDGAVIDAQDVEHGAREARSPAITSDGKRAVLLYSTSGPDETYFGHNRIVARDVAETSRGRAVRRATP